MAESKNISSVVISLDNLDVLQQQWADKGNATAPQPVLNSPRSLEACKRAGVNPSVDLAKPSVVEILREISNGATWPLSTEGLTPQKAAVLELIPLPGRHLGSFEEKRAAVEKYQHLEARRTTTIRMLQEIRQQLVAAEEFAARKANPNYKKMPANLPPTAGSPKRAVPQLPLRRMPHHRGGTGRADDEESLVSISTATASEMPRPSHNGTSTQAFLASRRASGARAASPTSSDEDDGSDYGVELIHITTTGKEEPDLVPPSPKVLPPALDIYDRTEALKDRGLHRTIKTPSTRTAATDSPPRPPPKLPPSSPPRPVPEPQQSTQDLVARVLEREAVARAANEVASRSRENSPQPREVSSSSSPSRFETSKSHRRQLIDQAIAFRAQQAHPKITSPSRADLVSPVSSDAYNYRSSAARMNVSAQKSPAASLYA